MFQYDVAMTELVIDFCRRRLSLDPVPLDFGGSRPPAPDTLEGLLGEEGNDPEEVLRIFARLNEEGRTVVLITHEPDVAAQTKRVIQLSDGQVVEDRRMVGVHDAPPAPQAQKSAHHALAGPGLSETRRGAQP